MKVKIEIIETLARTVEVEANSKEEAISIVKNDVDNCKIILNDNDYLGRTIDVYED